MLNLLKHEVKSRWIAIIDWGVGLFLFGAIYIYIYPTVQEPATVLAEWTMYQAMGFELGTFEGFVGSTIVLFISVWLGIYVIITSTQALAGEEEEGAADIEEEEGAADILESQPLSRWQIVSAKMIAIGVAVFSILMIAGLGNGIVLSWMKMRVQIDVTFGQLVAAVANGWPLLMVFAAMGLFLGAFLPNRRKAIILLSAIFIASYLGEILADQVTALAWIRPYSVFTYFDSSSHVFRAGIRVEDVLTLLGVAAVFYGLALISYQRRSVAVGG